MNRKKLSVCFATITLLSLGLIGVPAYGISSVAAYTAAAAGGQAPPNAAGGSSSYLILVAKGLPKDTADNLKNGLVNEGFTTADVQPGESGNFKVVLDGLSTSEQASALMADLKSSGYSPESIIENRGSALSTALSSESIYRVKVAEFDSALDAGDASEILANEGFVNVDVVPEKGKSVLMLGTFKNKSDAEALLSDVSNSGFALASVVSRQRLINSDSAAGDADLSGLSANEQSQTRDVLAMAQKVESGEASATEMKQLRELIQQLSANQKAVLNREEGNRKSDRDKMQRIFTQYRKFDQAIKTHDFTSAEEALAEVKQIDPNDIFLPNRLQVLESERSGGSSTDAGSGFNGKNVVDPATVQKLLNEGRSLQASGDKAGALQKFRSVLSMDPTNVEARSELAEQDIDAAPASDETADSGGMGDLLKNKNVLYGAGGLIALIIIGLWLKSRGSKSAPETSSGSSMGNSFDTTIDPLADSSVAETDFSSLNTASTTAPTMESNDVDLAAMSAFPAMGDDDEDEEKPPVKPAPVVAKEPESDSVSLADFEDEPQAPAPEVAPAAVPPVEDDVVSISFANDEVEKTESLPAAPATTEPVAESPTPAPVTGSAMDADLESLLKGTFPGASDEPEDLQSATPGEGVEDLTPVGAPEAAVSHTVFTQSFDNEAEGSQPTDWKGDYDFASLKVVNLNEAGHSQCLKYEKPEGNGSATYHLTFPNAKGIITAEFDIRCDEKNKFLLGFYLEHEEDFKQSVHTIVHQLDANAPASLRIQGSATDYQMGQWSHVRFEIDLSSGNVNGYVDNDQVVTNAQMATVPEYINTLSIRDNLSTTGTLYLDNIQISEA